MTFHISRTLFGISAVLGLAFVLSAPASAEDVLDSFFADFDDSSSDFETLDPAPPVVPVRLVDAVPSSASTQASSKPTSLELRQARAQYLSQQRIARLERNLWMGYEPLRPTWNAVPMMSSRYPYPQTYYVPVYIYPR